MRLETASHIKENQNKEWNLSTQALKLVLKNLNDYSWPWFYLKINSFTNAKFWSFFGESLGLQIFLKNGSSQVVSSNALW